MTEKLLKVKKPRTNKRVRVCCKYLVAIYVYKKNCISYLMYLLFFYIPILCSHKMNRANRYHGRIQRGGGAAGGPDPPEKSQNIGFPCNTGPDPLKNHKATKPAFNVGPSSARQQNAI